MNRLLLMTVTALAMSVLLWELPAQFAAGGFRWDGLLVMRDVGNAFFGLAIVASAARVLDRGRRLPDAS